MSWVRREPSGRISGGAGDLEVLVVRLARRWEVRDPLGVIREIGWSSRVGRRKLCRGS